MYQNRTAFIDELNNFVSSSRSSFNNVLKTINWTKQSLLSVKDIETFQNPSKDEPAAAPDISHMEEETIEGQVYILDMHYGNLLRTISFLQHTISFINPILHFYCYFIFS